MDVHSVFRGVTNWNSEINVTFTSVTLARTI